MKLLPSQHNTPDYCVTLFKAIYAGCMCLAVTCCMHFCLTGQNLLHSTVVRQEWNEFFMNTEVRVSTADLAEKPVPAAPAKFCLMPWRHSPLVSFTEAAWVHTSHTGFLVSPYTSYLMPWKQAFYLKQLPCSCMSSYLSYWFSGVPIHILPHALKAGILP